MPMTRELKKRFQAIDDRLEKVEKKKGVTNITNVGDPSPFEGSVIVTRLDMIEKVLMMPGPERKEGQVLSGYAEIVDQLFTQLKDRTERIEMVLQIPGETKGDDEILSAWREIIERQIRELQEVALPKQMMFDRPLVDWIADAEERISELERKPVAGALSNITQGITEDIEGVNREVTEVRSLVRCTTQWALIFFAITFLLLGLSFYLI